MQKPVPIAEAHLNADNGMDKAPPAMTEVQAAELRQLCERLDEPFDGSLNQEEAAERIRLLKERDGA